MRTFLIKLGSIIPTEEGIATVTSLTNYPNTIEVDLDGDVRSWTKSDVVNKLHHYYGLNFKLGMEDE